MPMEITSKSAANGLSAAVWSMGNPPRNFVDVHSKPSCRCARSTLLLRYALWLFLPGVVIGWGSRRTNDAKRKVHRLGSIIVLVLVT
jgi:hypothetical protein